MHHAAITQAMLLKRRLDLLSQQSHLDIGLIIVNAVINHRFKVVNETDSGIHWFDVLFQPLI